MKTARYRPEDRVRKRSEYRQIQSHGRRVHTRHFILLLHPSLVEGAHARLGITVTKKVGNAVERNHTKRVVREVFRRRREIFPPGFDVVLIAKRGAPQLTFAEVLKELEAVARPLAKAAKTPKSSKSPGDGGRRTRRGRKETGK